jgi:hypothetical protein
MYCCLFLGFVEELTPVEVKREGFVSEPKNWWKGFILF